jgi:isoleucyl-tRNA synthetase
VAKKIALEALEIQRKEFISWGIIGDWENPYRTMGMEILFNFSKIFICKFFFLLIDCF